MRRKFSSGFGTACECMCHKRAGTIDYCGYCSGSHSRALEDNNLLSIQEHIQSVSGADAQNSSSFNSNIGTAETPTANGSNKTVVIANS